MTKSWLLICLVLLLLASPRVGVTTAAELAVAETADAELEYRIAAGRLQTRLEQDIQLLQSIQALVETVERLAARSELAAVLLGESPDTAHLRAALQHNPQSSRIVHASSIVRAPRHLPSLEDISLAFLQLPDAHHLGKVIVRVGKRYVEARVGGILQLGGVPHTLRTIGADYALLAPVAGGSVRRVHWSGSTVEVAP